MNSRWLINVISKACEQLDLTVQKSNGFNQGLKRDTDLIVVNHSHLRISKLPQFKGVHVVRDPRETIVRSYLSHISSKEEWIRAPRVRYGGRSFLEHLSSLNQPAGLRAEADFFVDYAREHMIHLWNYHEENFLEIKFEQIFVKPYKTLTRILRHFEWSPKEIGVARRIAKTTGPPEDSLDKKTQLINIKRRLVGRKVYMHYRNMMKLDTLRYIESKLGKHIIKMGYALEALPAGNELN